MVTIRRSTIFLSVLCAFLGSPSRQLRAATFKTSSEAAAAAANLQQEYQAIVQHQHATNQELAATTKDWNDLRSHRADTSGTDRRLNDLYAKIRSIESAKADALAELRQGLFCSQCLRSKSEIEKGPPPEEFWMHLRRVNGQPIPASQQQLDAKAKLFDDEINPLQQEVAGIEAERQRIIDQYNQTIAAAKARVDAAYAFWSRLQQDANDCYTRYRNALIQRDSLAFNESWRLAWERRQEAERRRIEMQRRESEMRKAERRAEELRDLKEQLRTKQQSGIDQKIRDLDAELAKASARYAQEAQQAHEEARALDDAISRQRDAEKGAASLMAAAGPATPEAPIPAWSPTATEATKDMFDESAPDRVSSDFRSQCLDMLSESAASRHLRDAAEAIKSKSESLSDAFPSDKINELEEKYIFKAYQDRELVDPAVDVTIRDTLKDKLLDLTRHLRARAIGKRWDDLTTEEKENMEFNDDATNLVTLDRHSALDFAKKWVFDKIDKISSDGSEENGEAK